MADKLNPDLEALKRLCPEAAKWINKIIWIKPNTRLLNPDAKFDIPIKDLLAIAACIVRLGEETESSEDEKDVDMAYRQGKADGYQMGYDDGAAGLPRS